MRTGGKYEESSSRKAIIRNRTQTNKAKESEEKRAKLKAEQERLQAKLHTLDLRLKAVEAVVRHNEQSILNLGGAKYVEPPPKELVPIDDSSSHGDEKDDDAEAGQDTQQEQPTVAETLDSSAATETTSSRPWWDDVGEDGTGHLVASEACFDGV